MGTCELRDDIAFLEAAERAAGGAKRARGDVTDAESGAWGGAAKLEGKRRKKPAAAKGAARLQQACERRRVRLLRMAEGMSRRARNTSVVDGKDRLRWRVEWTFYIAADDAAPHVTLVRKRRATNLVLSLELNICIPLSRESPTQRLFRPITFAFPNSGRRARRRACQCLIFLSRVCERSPAWRRARARQDRRVFLLLLPA